MSPEARDRIEVLIVDDSATARAALTHVLEQTDDIDVIGTASDPFIAASKLSRRVPDVILLDLEMPRMDGLTFLKKLMSQRPLPVVVCSAHAGDGSENVLKALEYGAVEVIEKPRIGPGLEGAEVGIRIADAIRAASQARIERARVHKLLAIEPKLSADAVLPPPRPIKDALKRGRIVVVGASTGGTEAFSEFLRVLPEGFDPVVVVQHMPERFTSAFAQRLDTLTPLSVKEAVHGERLKPGDVRVAPGDSHAMIVRRGDGYGIELSDGPLVRRHRPSVDVLFRSAAREAGASAVGVLLTGMGDDGAQGLLEMRQAGAETLVQDEASCVVFGMPWEALRLGAAEVALPPAKLAKRVVEALAAKK